MTSEQVAYLAGFFDGEGSLGFWSNGKHAQGGYRPFQLSLSNSNFEIVQMFEAAFGGSVTEKHPKWASNKWQKKMMWAWRVYNEDAWNAYYAMQPWLREKRWKQEPKG